MKPWCFIRDAEGYFEGSFNLHSRNFKVPNTLIRFWLKTDCFSLVWHTVHTYRASENGHRKRIFWKALSRVLKTPSCCTRVTVDWWKRRFLKTMTSRAQIPVNAHAPIKYGTTYGLNSFSYSSVKYWNSLPDHFRKTVDYSEFKRKLLVHGFS